MLRSGLRLRSRSRLRLGSRSRFGLWTRLRHWLGLNRSDFGLWANLLLGSRLVRRAGLRLHRSCFRLIGMGLLLRFDGANLWLVGAVVWLHGSGLGLAGSYFRLNGPDLRLAGANFGLTRSYFRLSGTDRLYLRAVVWLAWADSWLNRWLAGSVWRRSGIGPRKAGLRGDGPGSGDHGRAALVHVVELLTVLRGFALVLDLSRHGRSS